MANDPYAPGVANDPYAADFAQPTSDAAVSAEAAPGTTVRAPSGQPPGRTRTSSAYKGLMAGAVVLILLLVFILENTQRTKISFVGISGHMPLGVALLLAAVAGALIVGIVGAARILQLRHRLRRSNATLKHAASR
jgi:uncharacterized integral membrane protein